MTITILIGTLLVLFGIGLGHQAKKPSKIVVEQPKTIKQVRKRRKKNKCYKREKKVK